MNWEKPGSDDMLTKYAFSQSVYEWLPHYTRADAPRDLPLEDRLFSKETLIHTGIHFQRYEEMKVYVFNEPKSFKPMHRFEDAPIDSEVKENVLRMGYKTPTPIQRNAIPLILAHKDLLGCAQTGSGKSAAYLVPIISNLLMLIEKHPEVRTRNRVAAPLALIIVPTRELAIQVQADAARFGYRTPIRPAVIYGGPPTGELRTNLACGCDVLIATPGRLKDFAENRMISLRNIRYLVLDEADRMLDMGFEAEIREVVLNSQMPHVLDRRTLLFSATFPRSIQRLAEDFIVPHAAKVRIGRIGGTPKDITQSIMYAEDWEKRNMLFEILKTKVVRTLIFVKTKREADMLDSFLYNKQLPTVSLHGDRTQLERESSLEAFRSGRSPIMIATSVASRGLDIKNIMHVINYHLPPDIDEYIHRIGRTARVGNPGFATSFYNENDSMLAPALTKLLQECDQDVPDFLQQYIDPDASYETPDSGFITTEELIQEEREGISNIGGGGGDSENWSSQQQVSSSGWQTKDKDTGGGWENKESARSDRKDKDLIVRGGWNTQDKPSAGNDGWAIQEPPSTSSSGW
ncbi:DEAD-box ATP-dependent RNA helicase [Actinomortierella ambigua]|nr:DEAD-box ATP-dependent RNA helicase [Actinomortierella ambigua]